MAIQRADPATRRRALVYGIAVMAVSALLAGAAAWLGVSPERLAQQLVERPALLPIGAALLVAPVTAFSVYLYIQGSRIRRAGRFPRPGQAVTRDTRVLTGIQALRRGRIVQVLAAVLLASSALVPFVAWRLAETLR